MLNRQRWSPESLSRLYLIIFYSPWLYSTSFQGNKDIAGALEVEAGLGVAELLEEVRGVNTIAPVSKGRL